MMATRVLQGVVFPEKSHNKFSYLWGVCAMYQAVNKIEKFEPKQHVLNPVLPIINDYYDPAPLSPDMLLTS
ncbi:MAG: hypothetical protein ACR2KZ_01370 [Segetibacter sp.]